MALRFYISSTFLDLQDERALIAEYLVQTEQLPIQTVYASANHTLEQCLQDVQSCHAMILLVASRYGSVIPGRDGVLRSVTHHEFHHARALKIPVLAFDLAYLRSSDDLADEQRQPFQTFMRELKNMERIVRPVRRKDCLFADVLVAVIKHIRHAQAVALSSSGDDTVFSVHSPDRGASPTKQDTMRSQRTEMYLQVQVKPKAGTFDLIPEVFLPSLDAVGWFPCPDADPLPCQGVPGAALVEVLNGLCKQAQRALPSWIDQLIIELLLPTEVLVDLLSEGQGCIPGSVGMCDAFRSLNSLHWPYLLRSLERAENSQEASVRSNRIRTHWQHAQGYPTLFACCRWPVGLGVADEEANGISQFRAALREPEGPVSALVSLLTCPSQPKQTGDVLKAIFESPLPVVLLWRNDGANPALRWARASDLLERSLPALPSAALEPDRREDGCVLHVIKVAPGAWCSRAAAQRRCRLLARKQVWVNKAVLLVDCPERWPRKITPPSPDASTRYQLRSTTTS